MGGRLALGGLLINNVCCTGIAITSDKSRAKVRDVHVYPRSVARSLSASESFLFPWQAAKQGRLLHGIPIPRTALPRALGIQLPPGSQLA